MGLSWTAGTGFSLAAPLPQCAVLWQGSVGETLSCLTEQLKPPWSNLPQSMKRNLRSNCLF